jgi:hypothetical protein
VPRRGEVGVVDGRLGGGVRELRGGRALPGVAEEIAEVRGDDGVARVGVGERLEMDLVRVTWPNGVVQYDDRRDLGDRAATDDALGFLQSEGLVGSCPFLKNTPRMPPSTPTGVNMASMNGKRSSAFRNADVSPTNSRYS